MHALLWGSTLLVTILNQPVPLPPSTAPLATTPEQAVHQYQQLMNAGKLEESLALVSSPVRGAWEATVRLVRSVQTFEDTLDQHFGKDPRHRRMFDPQAEAQAASNLLIRHKEELKTGTLLTVWKTKRGTDGRERISEERLLVVKEEGGWKLELPIPFSKAKASRTTRTGADGKPMQIVVLERPETPSIEQAAYLRWMIAQTTGAINDLSKEVVTGKYTSRAQALSAFRERMIPPQ